MAAVTSLIQLFRVLCLPEWEETNTFFRDLENLNSHSRGTYNEFS
jgi:hypothetical protein